MNQYTFNQYFSPAHSLTRGRKQVSVAQFILARALFAVLSLQDLKCISQVRPDSIEVISFILLEFLPAQPPSQTLGMCYGYSQPQHGSLVPRASPGMGTRPDHLSGSLPGLLRLPRLDSFWGWWPCSTSVFFFFFPGTHLSRHSLQVESFKTKIFKELPKIKINRVPMAGD